VRTGPGATGQVVPPARVADVNRTRCPLWIVPHGRKRRTAGRPGADRWYWLDTTCCTRHRETSSGWLGCACCPDPAPGAHCTASAYGAAWRRSRSTPRSSCPRSGSTSYPPAASASGWTASSSPTPVPRTTSPAWSARGAESRCRQGVRPGTCRMLKRFRRSPAG
jgi:hypothetical protein